MLVRLDVANTQYLAAACMMEGHRLAAVSILHEVFTAIKRVEGYRGRDYVDNQVFANKDEADKFFNFFDSFPEGTLPTVAPQELYLQSTLLFSRVSRLASAGGGFFFEQALGSAHMPAPTAFTAPESTPPDSSFTALNLPEGLGTVTVESPKTIVKELEEASEDSPMLLAPTDEALPQTSAESREE